MNNHTHTPYKFSLPSQDFWGCSCDKESLHSFEETKCPRCGIDKNQGWEIFIEDIILIVNEQEPRKEEIANLKRRIIHLEHKIKTLTRK